MPNTLEQQDLPEGDPGLLEQVKINGIYESTEQREPLSEPASAETKKFFTTTKVGAIALAASMVTIGMGIQKHRFAG